MNIKLKQCLGFATIYKMIVPIYLMIFLESMLEINFLHRRAPQSPGYFVPHKDFCESARRVAIHRDLYAAGLASASFNAGLV